MSSVCPDLSGLICLTELYQVKFGGGFVVVSETKRKALHLFSGSFMTAGRDSVGYLVTQYILCVHILLNSVVSHAADIAVSRHINTVTYTAILLT
jgi:hypothetical protein